ncbi:hypothetical protein ADT71_01490, partial [Novosphingobium sp. ST904]
MKSSPIGRVLGGTDATQQAQYASLQTQVPLMYALMFFNALFLSWATYGEVPYAHSVGVPMVLSGLIGVRALLWLSRRKRSIPPLSKIRRHLLGTVAASVLISAAFGWWGYLLMSEADPIHTSAVALYVFIGSISCCYCLHALPIAGWLVILFGALPVTARL